MYSMHLTSTVCIILCALSSRASGGETPAAERINVQYTSAVLMYNTMHSMGRAGRHCF
jgi:hypothetical protein